MMQLFWLHRRQSGAILMDGVLLSVVCSAVGCCVLSVRTRRFDARGDATSPRSGVTLRHTNSTTRPSAT